jgi:hypothetical protein
VAQCGKEGESRHMASHRSTAPSRCTVGHPRLCGGLGTGSSTWQGRGEPTGEVWAVGGLARATWGGEGRRGVGEQLEKRPTAVESRARAETEQERGWRLKTRADCDFPKIQGLHYKA